MTEMERSKRQSLGFMETVLLYNSGILLNHPAVCISCFCSLEMPEGRHFITVKDQVFFFFHAMSRHIEICEIKERVSSVGVKIGL